MSKVIYKKYNRIFVRNGAAREVLSGIIVGGQRLTFLQLSDMCGVSPSSIKYRVKAGHAYENLFIKQRINDPMLSDQVNADIAAVKKQIEQTGFCFSHQAKEKLKLTEPRWRVVYVLVQGNSDMGLSITTQGNYKILHKTGADTDLILKQFNACMTLVHSASRYLKVAKLVAEVDRLGYCCSVQAKAVGVINSAFSMISRDLEMTVPNNLQLSNVCRWNVLHKKGCDQWEAKFTAWLLKHQSEPKADNSTVAVRDDRLVAVDADEIQETPVIERADPADLPLAAVGNTSKDSLSVQRKVKAAGKSLKDLGFNVSTLKTSSPLAFLGGANL